MVQKRKIKKEREIGLNLLPRNFRHLYLVLCPTPNLSPVFCGSPVNFHVQMGWGSDSTADRSGLASRCEARIVWCSVNRPTGGSDTCT